MAKALPLFTLCTNLGQLVDQRALAETLAMWKLERVKKERAVSLQESRSLVAMATIKPTYEMLKTFVGDMTTLNPGVTSKKEGTDNGSASVQNRNLPSDKKLKTKDKSVRLERLASLVMKGSMAQDTTKADDEGDAEEGNEIDHDLPDILNSSAKTDTEIVEEHPKSCCTTKKVSTFFHTRYFRLLDFSLGTMPALFLVGMRMELLLVAGCHIANSQNTWNLDLRQAYFLELFWLVMLIAESLFIILFFSTCRGSFGRRTMVLAASWDLFICVVCLALLLGAEFKRCCEPFGENVGLGKIEPFTCLVLLRSFKFLLSRKLFKHITSKRSSRLEDAKDQEENHHEESDSHGHEMTGTIEELWNHAVGLHPDIAKEYGEFSSEMLKAMLGIPYERKHNETGVNEEPKPMGGARTEIMELEHQFATLPTDVQEVICAGKIGKAVQIISTSLGTIDESDSETERQLPAPKLYVNFVKKDTNKLLLEDDDDAMFQAPNAMLIQQMRRCQWKLLPISTYWSLVDVAVSKYEIVLLEASDSESEAISPEQRNVLDALIATKGGKGLRMCDVASGRKVVGQLKLSDISSLTVDRLLSSDGQESSTKRSSQRIVCSDLSNSDIEMSGNSCRSMIRTEYWKVDRYLDCGTTSIASRWEKMVEDRLKIVAQKGTVHLRFFSDLEKSKNEGKSSALIWCQTIVRVCGPNALSQDLPKFGLDTEHEDLIHTRPRKDDNRGDGKRHWNKIRNARSLTAMVQTESSEPKNDNPHGDGKRRSLPAMVQTESSEPKNDNPHGDGKRHWNKIRNARRLKAMVQTESSEPKNDTPHVDGNRH